MNAERGPRPSHTLRTKSSLQRGRVLANAEGSHRLPASLRRIPSRLQRAAFLRTRKGAWASAVDVDRYTALQRGRVLANAEGAQLRQARLGRGATQLQRGRVLANAEGKPCSCACVYMSARLGEREPRIIAGTQQMAKPRPMLSFSISTRERPWSDLTPPSRSQVFEMSKNSCPPAVHTT